MRPSNVFDPQSSLAGATVDLLNATLVISALIFLLVTGLVIYCVVRFRGGPGKEEPQQFRGHKTLEIVWTVIPALLLVYMFVLTVRAMNASDPPKLTEPDILVVGHQFWWEVRYLKSGIITANEIHIPTGQKLLFRLQTADVIHNFWVPQLSRKMDMVPDRANQLWLAANRPGVYHGACSEFCGAQHAWMRLLVIAHTPEEYTAWEERQRPSASTPAPAANPQGNGARFYQQLTCVNCHAINGQPVNIVAGPDLGDVASRRTLGAGVVTNSPENLARWLKNPQALKPGNLMPNMALTDEQVRELVEYLQTLK